MRIQMQRWFLILAGVTFLAFGCFTLYQAWSETLLLGYAALGIFYCFVGNMCMWQHIRDVAGDWDDEEPWASY